MNIVTQRGVTGPLSIPRSMSCCNILRYAPKHNADLFRDFQRQRGDAARVALSRFAEAHGDCLGKQFSHTLSACSAGNGGRIFRDCCRRLRRSTPVYHEISH